MRSYVLCVMLVGTSFLQAFPALERRNNPQSWVGRTIILKVNSVILRNQEDKEIGTVSRTDYVVLREDDEKIWIKDLSREGWVPRSQVLLASDALAFLTEQINANPNDHWLFAKRSKVHEYHGKLENALADYNEAIRLNPNSSGWINNRGNVHTRMRNFANARDDYLKAAMLNPGSAIVCNNLGNAYLNLREYQEALKQYEQGMKLDPEYALLYANRANCYREIHQYDKALADLEIGLKKDETQLNLLLNRATVYIELNQPDRALRDIREAENRYPRTSGVYSAYGMLHMQQKAYRRALFEFDHALWLDPFNIPTQFRRAECYQALKLYADAKRDFEAVLQFDPKYTQAMESYVIFLTICPDESFRDLAKAEKLIQSASELTRNRFGSTQSAWAVVHAEKGRFPAAIDLAEKALQDKTLSDEQKAEIRKQLECYKQNKPWRLP